MRQLLTERMSFRQLFSRSERGRKQRGRSQVKSKSSSVRSLDEGEAWTFSYKSSPSTTGNRWHGFIRFFKQDASNKQSAMDLDCMIDCDCPDYRFRYAYNNSKADAGFAGDNPNWKYSNQNNGRPPRPRSQGGVGDYGVGMCKHLCGLADYLKTKIEPNAPDPDDAPPIVTKRASPPVPAAPPKAPTTRAPSLDRGHPIRKPPGGGYSDSRELQEGKSSLSNRIDRFAKENPEFEISYEE